VAMKQDAVGIATLRDAPQGRYAARVDFSVRDALRFLGHVTQSFENIPNGREAQVGVVQPILDRSEHLGQMVRLHARHDFSPRHIAYVL
jgi:hypothetical protein